MNNTYTTLVHIRHGSVMNPHKLYYLRSPGVHLSEEGKIEAQRVGQQLLHSGIRLDYVYHSPRERAEETTNIIAQIHRLNRHQVIIDGRLDEVNYPGVQNTPYIPLRLPLNPSYYWEVPRDVVKRTSDLLQVVLHKHEGKTIGLVSHDATLLFTIAWENGIDLNKMQTVEQVLERLNEIYGRTPEYSLDPGHAYVTKISPTGRILEGILISPDSSHHDTERR